MASASSASRETNFPNPAVFRRACCAIPDRLCIVHSAAVVGPHPLLLPGFLLGFQPRPEPVFAARCWFTQVPCWCGCEGC